MNSKDALDKLVMLAQGDSYIPNEEVAKCYIKLKKDLETLELLQPIIVASIYLEENNQNIGYITKNVEASKLLREWLKYGE